LQQQQATQPQPAQWGQPQPASQWQYGAQQAPQQQPYGYGAYGASGGYAPAQPAQNRFGGGAAYGSTAPRAWPATQSAPAAAAPAQAGAAPSTPNADGVSPETQKWLMERRARQQQAQGGAAN
jgi:hypothetical protein